MLKLIFLKTLAKAGCSTLNIYKMSSLCEQLSIRYNISLGSVYEKIAELTENRTTGQEAEDILRAWVTT